MAGAMVVFMERLHLAFFSPEVVDYRLQLNYNFSTEYVSLLN